MKVIIDDFGHDLQNDLAILDLIKSKPRFFYGVSCAMTNFCESTFAELRQITSVKKGLHLTLTSFPSVEFPSTTMPKFRNIMIQSFTRPHTLFWVERECIAQIEAFLKAFGHFPDFLDGHQHVHQLPVVRDAVLKVLAKYSDQIRQNFFVRNSFLNWESTIKVKYLGSKTMLKNILLGLIGRDFKYFLIQNRINTNSQLFGTYVINKNMTYETVYSAYNNIPSSTGGILYCHPGFVSEALLKVERPQPDRHAEMTFFRSISY